MESAEAEGRTTAAAGSGHSKRTLSELYSLSIGYDGGFHGGVVMWVCLCYTCLFCQVVGKFELMGKWSLFQTLLACPFSKKCQKGRCSVNSTVD